MIFCSEQHRWRMVRPGDEAGFCRAFAAWEGPRRALAGWPAGPGLPYAACIAAVSAQLEADAGDNYRWRCEDDGGRALVANECVYVLAGCDVLYVAIDPAPERAPYNDVYAALGEALTWLWHCGARGDVETAVLLNGQVEEAMISVADRPPDLYPIAFCS